MAVLQAFHFKYTHFIFEGILVLGGLNLKRKEILLHSFKDVIVGRLRELFLLYFMFSIANRIV